MGLTDLLGNLDHRRYACIVYIDSNLLPANYQIISVQIKKSLQYITSAEIYIKQDMNIQNALINDNSFSSSPCGQAIVIKAILEEHDIVLFEGFLVKRHFKSSIKGNRIKLIAKSKVVKMAMTRKTEIFSSTSDRSIIETICQNNGFTVNFDQSVMGKLDTAHTQSVKHRISDWDYINLRAEMNSCYVYTENEEIIILSPSLDKTIYSVTAAYGENVFELEIDEDRRADNVDNVLRSLDLTTLESSSIKSDTISYGNTSAIKADEEIINYRTFNEIESNNLLESYNHLQKFSDINGLAHIQADFNPKPGDLIKFKGFLDLDNKQLLVSGIMHDYSEGGFSTYVQFGLNHETYKSKYLSENEASIKPLTISGIVQAIEDDPDNLSRILVTIPIWRDAQEGLWARHSTPYAGSDYGLILLPEIGDEVLVSFLGDDLDSPVIIGSVFNPKSPPFENSDDSNYIKSFVTKKGMKWSWDDDKGIHEVSTASGNKIIISEEDRSITLIDENGNEIEMKNGSIKIESQTDLKIKAANQITMEAAKIDIVASGITTVKGALIKLN